MMKWFAKAGSTETKQQNNSTCASHTVTVNRSPVMILWAAVTAEALGCDWSESLSLGSAVAG